MCRALAMEPHAKTLYVEWNFTFIIIIRLTHTHTHTDTLMHDIGCLEEMDSERCHVLAQIAASDCRESGERPQTGWIDGVFNMFNESV